MLARTLRVRKERIEVILKKGSVYHSPFITSRFLKKTGHSSFAVVVPKAVSPLAVVRNKMKRRIWSLIAAVQTDIFAGYDILFFAKKGSAQLDFGELQKEFFTLLEKSSLSAKKHI